MRVFLPFDFLTCFPIPDVESLVLRGADDVVTNFVVEDRDCIFVVFIFSDQFMLR